MTTNRRSITEIEGILVGHAQDGDALTGCTVVLCKQGATGGVEQRGGAPGTRETDLLKAGYLVEKVHAIVLSGGSAYGLDAAAGVMRYLEEHGVGYDTRVARVPIVPAAILFDLGLGNPKIRPDAEMGYLASQAASDRTPAEGNVGAGCGASVGKIMGLGQATKAGIGAGFYSFDNGLMIGALAAVNAFGDVIHPKSGQIIAGARAAPGQDASTLPDYPFINTLQVMKSFGASTATKGQARGNTVIGVVVTNARLSKAQANKVSQMADDGIARTIRPAHTMMDGDTVFTLATGEVVTDVNLVGSIAAEVFAEAIIRAVEKAEPAGGLPAAKNLV